MAVLGEERPAVRQVGEAGPERPLEFPIAKIDDQRVGKVYAHDATEDCPPLAVQERQHRHF